MIAVTVNGEPRELLPGTTLADLLAAAQLDARYLAAEVNRRVVPRAEHSRAVLQPGDAIEIVTLVGGG